MGKETKIRKEIMSLAYRIEFAMQPYDNGEHWHDMTQDILRHNLPKKMTKILNSVAKNNHDETIKHATDIAAYCVMLADNAENFKKTREAKQIDFTVKAAETYCRNCSEYISANIVNNAGWCELCQWPVDKTTLSCGEYHD